MLGEQKPHCRKNKMTSKNYMQVILRAVQYKSYLGL